MQTNFFRSIVAMQVAGDWKINIAKETADKLVVSVLFFNDNMGDDARKKIPPVLLKGTAEELDEGFFIAVEEPIKDTATLFINMEAYLKEKEQAKLQSQIEKDKAAKAEKDKSEKQKKYEEAMKKVDELDAEGKHRDAWVKVPDPAIYPEYADSIRKRKSQLSAKFSPNLFEEPKTESPC